MLLDVPHRDRRADHERSAGVLGRRGLLDQFGFDGDFYFVAYYHAAGFGQCVEGHAEVLAVDLGGRSQACAGISPGIFYRRRRAVDVQGDFLCGAANGQIADHDVVFRAAKVDLLRAECDVGMVRGVEEIGAAKMFVALRFARIDRGGFDGYLDLGLGQIGRVDEGGSG
jgi:hypothetical protein